MKKRLFSIVIAIAILFTSIIVHAESSHSDSMDYKINYSGGSVVSDSTNIILGGKYVSIISPKDERIHDSHGTDWITCRISDSGEHDGFCLDHKSGTTTYNDAWYIIKNALKYNGKYYDTKTTILKVTGPDTIIGNKLDSKLTGHLDARGKIVDGLATGNVTGQVEVQLKIEIFEPGTTEHAYIPNLYLGLLDVDQYASFYMDEKLTKDNSFVFNVDDVSTLMYNSSDQTIYSTYGENTNDIANVYWKSNKLKNDGVLELRYGWNQSAGVFMGFGTIEGLPVKSYASDTPSGKDGATVKVGDKIKYQIDYTNGSLVNDASVTITDIISKGLEYVPGSAVITVEGSNGNSTSVEPTVTKNIDGTTTLVWNSTLAKSSSAKLTYSAKVTNDAVEKVKNKAVAKIGEYEYKLDELENPLLKINNPNTYGTVVIVLILVSFFTIYFRFFKKERNN